MKARMVLSSTYEARIRGVEALLAARDANTVDSAGLRAIADEVETISGQFEHTPTAGVFAAFGESLRIAAQVVDWRTAVLTAQPDADRFLRAARERRRLWSTEIGNAEKAEPAVKALHAVTSSIESLSTATEAAAFMEAVALTPLPVGVFEAESRPRLPSAFARPPLPPEREEPPEDLAVAFVKFTLDGQLAAETHYLQPHAVHDLDIEVRVNRWPRDAETLELRPVSIEAASTYELPVFNLVRPPGEAPYIMHARGRAIIKIAQSLHARPFEFKYTARFTPQATEQPVAVVGQRTLRIEGIDLGQSSFSGYPNLDAKIVEIREQLRSLRLATPQELSDLLSALAALANFSGRAAQGATVKGVWSEARLQQELTDDLRRRPEIGGRLEEHPHGGGGITDLSLGGVRIELKSVSNRRLVLADCEQFVDQTVSYAVASGKRVALLCVLDCSLKTTAPFPTDEGLGILSRQTAGPPVCVVTVLIQGNLKRPSDHSRRRDRPQSISKPDL